MIGLVPIPQIAIIELARSVVFHGRNPYLKHKQLQHQLRQLITLTIEQLYVIVFNQNHCELLQTHMSRDVVCEAGQRSHEALNHAQIAD